MKLYWGEHTCAMGIQALLEEAGVRYEMEKVDVQGGATHREPFKSLNPKEKVPVLVRDDGSMLTEWGAIARWIAGSYPDKHLVPDQKDAETRATEVMDYVIGTLHGQAFARIFFPERFTKEEGQQRAVKQDGKAMVARCFAILDEELGDRPFAAGDAFSIADAALFYTETWAKLLKMDLPQGLAAHHERIAARPSFKTALETHLPPK